MDIIVKRLLLLTVLAAILSIVQVYCDTKNECDIDKKARFGNAMQGVLDGVENRCQMFSGGADENGCLVETIRKEKSKDVMQVKTQERDQNQQLVAAGYTKTIFITLPGTKVETTTKVEIRTKTKIRRRIRTIVIEKEDDDWGNIYEQQKQQQQKQKQRRLQPNRQQRRIYREIVKGEEEEEEEGEEEEEYEEVEDERERDENQKYENNAENARFKNRFNSEYHKVQQLIENVSISKKKAKDNNYKAGIESTNRHKIAKTRDDPDTTYPDKTETTASDFVEAYRAGIQIHAEGSHNMDI
ncbi:hypothetical protein AX774_g3187 [Zancudomyces culisetae]|uniref:Uncharacterized protein n=1 Tax=Zancudomyces culisetae TaxID=1213189 RepID=A0A1R1PQP5_ZANCU|nr:hypothetical protein AX774_g3187 [Zancudomyces culisetae]|eukprot:OMH83306.1 hypothetical protein AX774_g3187 [Zancudomyces culisetae]